MKLYVMNAARGRGLAERLNEAVDEVFQRMLGVRCTPMEAAGCTLRQESFGAVAGFAGAMLGSCVLRMDRASGLLLAELLTGREQTDETKIHDGLGEMCSGIARAWTGRVPRLASGCMVSPPMVIAGYDYRLYWQPSPLQIQAQYQFGAAEVEVTLRGDLENCSEASG